MIVEGTRIEGTETRAECELRIVLVLKLQGERVSEELGVGVWKRERRIEGVSSETQTQLFSRMTTSLRPGAARADAG
jgi:hypothetical protein